jgi:hypothetical protein
MMLLPVVLQIQDAVKMKEKIFKYKKSIIITTSVILLQLIFGFEPKFCIINIIWLFV